MSGQLVHYVGIRRLEILSVDPVGGVIVPARKPQAHLQFRIVVSFRLDPVNLDLTDQFHRIRKVGQAHLFFYRDIGKHNAVIYPGNSRIQIFY